MNTPVLSPSLRRGERLSCGTHPDSQVTRSNRDGPQASWSLARPAAETSLLITHIITIHSAVWQAGVLRKMRSTPLAGRIAFQEPLLQRHARGLRARNEIEGSEGSSQLSDAWEEVERKAPAAIAAGLKKLGPCAGASLDDDGIWKRPNGISFPCRIRWSAGCDSLRDDSAGFAFVDAPPGLP